MYWEYFRYVNHFILSSQFKKYEITSAGKIPCVPLPPQKVTIILNLSL